MPPRSAWRSVPMFLPMGFAAFHAELTAGLFDAAKAVRRRLPGALAISSILACSGFAAVCGSSLATAASMGRIAQRQGARSPAGAGAADRGTRAATEVAAPRPIR